MKAVLDAIYTKITGSAFSTAIGGRYFPIQAEIGTAKPYAVGAFVPMFEHEMAHTFIEGVIELSIYASNLTDLAMITALADTLFDGATLTVSGFTQYEQIDKDSELQLKEDEVWKTILEYSLLLKKN